MFKGDAPGQPSKLFRASFAELKQVHRSAISQAELRERATWCDRECVMIPSALLPFFPLGHQILLVGGGQSLRVVACMQL